jgi:hypothetical protein
VQLDNTHISVKERNLVDICDLSLHVLRQFWRPIVLTSLVGAIPLMVINHLLIGWMMSIDNNNAFFYLDEAGAITRYVWDMSLLIAIEAPLASIFATAYLGQAVFVDNPNIREVFRDVFKMLPRVLWCQLLVRGILPAWLLILAVPRYEDWSIGIEGMLFPMLAIYAVGLRSFRPFINEIVLLEKNPLLSRNHTAMTISRRSTQLHGPSSSDLFSQGFAMSIMTICLATAMFGNFVFLKGVFANSWKVTPFMLLYAMPLACWMVAIYLNVVRFLRYLDLRIRHEGWEVELRMRAEANRMVTKSL